MKTRSDSVLEGRQLTDDLMYEILVHLPSYSLMRFKCVSKLWNSIIRNPNFAKDHSLRGACFRGILVTHSQTNHDIMSLYHANVNDSSCTFYHKSTLDLSNSTHLFRTKIVKSLVGFFSYDGITVCNLTTHEFMDLPKVGNAYCTYHLGFDPIQDVYKVLNIYDDDHASTSLARVFTVGKDSAWRNIGIFPNNYLTECRCINGTLYFFPSSFFINNQVYFSMIAFHFNSESYEIIPVPTDNAPSSHDVAEIDGNSVVLLYEKDCNPLDMDVWVMKTDSTTGLWVWTRHKVEFPIANLKYFGMIPTGELLLADNKSLHMSKYDHNKNKLELIKLDGHWDRLEDYNHLCYYEEGIMPLGSLIKM